MYDLGSELGLPNNQIESIRTDNCANITQAVYEMLKVWAKQQEFEAQHAKDELKLALIDSDMGQIANDIL